MRSKTISCQILQSSASVFLTLFLFSLTATSCTKHERPATTGQANPEAIVFGGTIDEAFDVVLASGLTLGWQVVLVDSPHRVLTFREPKRFGAYVTVRLTYVPNPQSAEKLADALSAFKRELEKTFGPPAKPDSDKAVVPPAPAPGIRVDASGPDRRAIELLFKQISSASGDRVQGISEWLNPVDVSEEVRVLEEARREREERQKRPNKR